MCGNHLTKKDMRIKLPECICAGNWKELVSEYSLLIGRKYKDEKGIIYTFFGLVYGDDDYYFGMWGNKELRLLSCVATPENMGFNLVEKEG